MFVLELYFVFYRVPKMMTRLARERGRSPWRWSLVGMGAWIGAEFAILFIAGTLYGAGVALFAWPMPTPTGLKLVMYVLALLAALASVTIVSRILTGKRREESFSLPPPPPSFPSTSENAG